jgi:hypothetical protein
MKPFVLDAASLLDAIEMGHSVASGRTVRLFFPFAGAREVG